MNKIIIMLIIVVTSYLIYLNFKMNDPKKIEYKKKVKRNIDDSFKKNMENFEKVKELIDQYIVEDRDINCLPEELKKLLLYSLDGGKRVRGVIIVSVFNSCNPVYKHKRYVTDMALAMEYVHCASLILDDIMDKDVERRGKTCLHIKYSEAVAQLVAIQLLTISFDKLFSSLESLSKENQNMNKNLPIILCKNISNNLKKITTGQFQDITINKFNVLGSINNKNVGDAFKKVMKSNKNIDCEKLIHLKTSTLFEMCFVGAYILGNCEKSDEELDIGIEQMKKIGQKFGLLFQIADDFDDVEQDLNRDGKNAIMNYVINKGQDQAYLKYKESVRKFIDLSSQNGIISKELLEISDYLSSKVDKKMSKKILVPK